MGLRSFMLLCGAAWCSRSSDKQTQTYVARLSTLEHIVFQIRTLYSYHYKPASPINSFWSPYAPRPEPHPFHQSAHILAFCCTYGKLAYVISPANFVWKSRLRSRSSNLETRQTGMKAANEDSPINQYITRDNRCVLAPERPCTVLLEHGS